MFKVSLNRTPYYMPFRIAILLKVFRPNLLVRTSNISSSLLPQHNDFRLTCQHRSTLLSPIGQLYGRRVLIWTWRNKKLHDPLFVFPFNLISEIHKQDSFYRISNSLIYGLFPSQKQSVSLRLCPPSPCQICLNLDGACKVNFGASCGGLFRDNFCRWLSQISWQVQQSLG